MTPDQINAAEDCARGSWTGKLTFPDVIDRLNGAGFERYHADYSRHEITYYLPDGESHVVGLPHAPFPIGAEFLAAAVATAVGQSQRNEHTYPDFVRKTMAAGCVGYFVQVTGRRIIYFGRNGETHVEHFPSAKPTPQVRCVLETALYVKEPHRSAEFYRRVFGFPVLLESDRLVALDVVGKSVLLLFKEGMTAEPFPTVGGTIPGHWGTGHAHFAFGVTTGDVPAWRDRLAAERVPVESEVRWPGGAFSLYFRDPDGHLAELITEGFWRTY
jgi:catechol 2,3-dioxygenase-like lactoylglutathione lyase family enzyme/uncharacterized protein YbcV (DUF1398 family)